MRHRVEIVIRLLSPALNLVLAVGDRVSRVVDRQQLDDAQVRVPGSVAGSPRPVARRALPPGFERRAETGEH